MATTKSKSPPSPQEKESRVRERLLLSEGPPVSQQEVLETAKIIRDETRNFISHQMKSLQQEVERLDTGLGTRFGEELDRHTKNLRDELARREKSYGERLDSRSRELGEQLLSLEKSYGEKLVELNSYHSSQLQASEKSYGERLALLEKSYQERLLVLEKSLGERVALLEASYFAGLEQVKELLKALPIPQVIVPENAIQVKQLPSQVVLPEGAIRVDVNQSTPQVNVSIPEKSLSVEVHQLPSIVNMTEKSFHFTVDQPAPQVNFSVPENAFHLEVPQRGLVRKSISYNDHGQPVEILESEEGK